MIDEIFEEEESFWGPHEYCEFKCGPDCTCVYEKDPKVTVICENGHVYHGVQAHYDSGDRSVGIQEGYWVEIPVDDDGWSGDGFCLQKLDNSSVECEEELHIIEPAQYAAVLPSYLRSLIEQNLGEDAAKKLTYYFAKKKKEENKI